LTDETTQRKWQRILAEYAIARVEHQIACSLMSKRPQAFREAQSAEHLAEEIARDKLMKLRDQLAELEAAFYFDDPGTTAS
jgi:hypothetical protein